MTRSMIACVLGLCIATGMAWAADGTSACAGDCNGDGEVGIEELVAAVAAALGTPAPDGCTGFDLDGDGRIAVDELVRLVGAALGGCPLPLDAAGVDGVYDADARSQVDPSGGLNKSGVAVITPLNDGLEIEVRFGLLESLSLLASAGPGGSVTMHGDGTVGGDISVIVSGSARLVRRDGVVELRGVLDFASPLVAGTSSLDAVFARPALGTPAAYSGVQRFVLQHPAPGGAPALSQVDLPIAVPASGRATCGATADVAAGGTVRASLPETGCLVSPTGRFLYAAPYRVPGSAPVLPLQMSGGLSAGDGIGRGVFFIAAFPTIAESGPWQAEQQAR